MSEDIGPNDSPDPQDCGWVSGAAYSKLESDLAATRQKLAEMPADWSKDSSLETWFPLTAQELERLRAENAELQMKVTVAHGMLHGTPGVSEGAFDFGKRVAAKVNELHAALTEIANPENYHSGQKFFFASALQQFAKDKAADVKPEPCKDCSALRAQRDQAVLRVREVQAAFEMDQPWSAIGAAKKLCEAVTHLLDDHGCDTEGHEQFRTALKRMTQMLPKLEAATLNPPTSDDTLKV